jgi:ADP-heptose:LPS heptosyltransferase
VEPSQPAPRVVFPNGAGATALRAGAAGDQRERADPLAAARRILVVRPDNIGDVILASPALRALRAYRPDAVLGLLASPAGAAAAALLPWVDEVIEARPAWQQIGGDSGPTREQELELIACLARGTWDAAIVLTSLRQTPWAAAYAAFLAGIPTRAGLAADFGGALLTHPIEPPPLELHAAHRNLALLEALGVAPAGDRLEIRVPDAARRSVTARLAASGVGDAPFLLVAPGASAPARRVDPVRLGAAAWHIGETIGAAVVVTGAARDGALVAQCARAAPGSVSLADLSVPELAALVERTVLVLCCNSAPMHLADALGRPVVVAFAGTELGSQWAPRYSRHRLVARPVPCAPCYRITCPIGNACLDVTAEEIAAAALSLVGAGPAPGRPGGRQPAPEGGERCAA